MAGFAAAEMRICRIIWAIWSLSGGNGRFCMSSRAAEDCPDLVTADCGQLPTSYDSGDSHTRIPTEEDSRQQMLEWHDLNARHAATFLWLAVLLILCSVGSADVRRSGYALLKTFLDPAIMLLTAGLLVYVACISIIAVIVGRKMGILETLPVVTTITWAVTTGFSLLSQVGEFLKRNNVFRSRAVAILGPSTIVATVGGVAVLPFWLEVILVPILSVLVIVVYSNRGACLSIVASILLLSFVVGSILIVLNDWGRLETMRSLKQSIMFPLTLTVGTLPFIQLLVKVERFRFSRGAKCKTVRSSDYGQDWPLTVNSAKICCRYDAVWIEVDGRKFGVNGTAEGVLKSYGFDCFALNNIWGDHPDGESTGLKVNIGRLIHEGLALERQ